MKRRPSNSDSDDPLVEALYRLREELTIVRQVLDEIFTELQWANQNRGDSDSLALPVRGITSMPLDPTVPDWAERLNQLSAADVPTEKPVPPLAEPGRLF